MSSHKDFDVAAAVVPEGISGPAPCVRLNHRRDVRKLRDRIRQRDEQRRERNRRREREMWRALRNDRERARGAHKLAGVFR